MAYHINFSDVYQDHVQNNKDVNHIVLPNNLGSSHAYNEDISHDISLTKHDMTINEDFEMLVEDINENHTLSININFPEKEYGNNYVTKSKKDAKSHDISIEYKNQRKDIFKFTKNTKLESLGIFIKDSFLEENFFSLLKDEKRMEIEKNMKNNIRTLFKSSRISSKTLALAREIYTSPFNGVLNNLYIQSRVYEIIHDELLSIINIKNKEPRKNKIILNQDDIDALHKAKELILQDKKHFSLAELSKKVALNKTKLKYGFKELFNTTPGHIMLTARMYEAKRLLETSEYNVTEIAQITGYKYSQNFTNAFIKFFATTPSEIMKNRKYYY